MIIRWQEHQLLETLLDKLVWLKRRDYKATQIDSDTKDLWMRAKSGLLTYNGNFGLVSSKCHKGLI